MKRITVLRIGAAASALFAFGSITAAGYAQYQNQVERCFGAVGSGCAGAPFAGASKLANGNLRMKVSVGSILHDNCCLAKPNGKWCGKYKETGHDGNCDKEWNKAFWNSQPTDNRQWDWEFNPNENANLTVVSNPRTASFASNYQGGGIPRNFETVATRKLGAPRGTNLDVGDQAFCASGRASAPKSSFNKQWITCE